MGPPRGPPGGPPGGPKSAHFFGYLITLPVGTVWALFFGPPGTPQVGPYRGYVGWDSAYRSHGTELARYGWAGALGRRASDGYPLDGLTANGWYVPSGRAPPSRQGRKSAQHREGMRRRRPFAEPNAARRLECPARCGRAPQDRQSLPRSSWGSTLGRPSGPQPMGTDGGSEADPGRGTHSRSELTTPHLSHLSQRTTFNNYCKKAKMAEFGILGEFGGNGLLTGPGRRPRTSAPVVAAALGFWALIAQ